jgi:hypothetical protein
MTAGANFFSKVDGQEDIFDYPIRILANLAPTFYRKISKTIKKIAKKI